MKITEETTRFVFREYDPNQLSILRKLMMADEKHFLYEDEDYVACPIGVENYIQKRFPDTPIKENPPWPSAKMKYIPKETPVPRNRLQKDAIKFLSQNKGKTQLGLITTTGSGKAEPYTNWIPTPKGDRMMGDLRVGDSVFARDGSRTKVIGIFEQGVQKTYGILFEDGRKARCVRDHLWEVKCVSRENPEESFEGVRSLGSILKLRDRYHVYIPTCNPVQYEDGHSIWDPYAMGYLLATCDPNDDRLAARVSPEMAHQLQVRLHSLVQKERNKYIFCTEDLNPIKRLLFLSGSCTLSPIPLCIQHGGIRTRKEFLNGFHDGCGKVLCRDGHYLPYYIGLNEHLMIQIRELYWGLGYLVTTSGNREDGYSLLVEPANERNTWLEITEIWGDEEENCRCIMVDNEEHLYLTTDFIVTHNTYMSIKHAITLGEKTLILCPSTNIIQQWVDTLKNMFHIPESRILYISDTSKLSRMEGDYDWVLVLEQTIQTLVPSHRLEPLLKKSRFGLKITDEIHMFLKNNIVIDCSSNIPHSLYLTGTFFRTQEEESNLFQAIYHGILRFEVIEQEDIERYGQPKHIELYSVIINSKLTRREVNHIVINAKISKYKSVKTVSIGRYMAIVCPEDGRVTEYMRQSLAVIKRMRERVDYGRMLVLVPSINATQKFRKLIADMYPKLKVGCINSDQSRSLNTRVKQEADIIVSTSKSSGVGFDMKDLSVLVAVEQFRSPVLVEQISGRLRPRPDQRSTFYVDIADASLGRYLLTWRDDRLARLKRKAKSYTQFRLNGTTQ